MGNVCSFAISTEDTVPRCWDCVSAQASYTCKLDQNLKALTVELEKLRAKRDDVNQMVDLAEQQLMKRLSQVQVWLSRVQTVVAEADELIEDGPQEIRKLCFASCFSRNCMSSYKFGKQVAKKLEEIVELKKEGIFDKVAQNEPAARVEVRPTEPTVGLESTLGKVLSLLEGNEVGMIGLQGLGGVGKTTLLTQINNKLSNMLMCYDVVIWVVVSKDYTVENVQQKIGEKLGLSNSLWMNKSSDEKAIVLFRILSKKKFVLWMDDVWEWVNLLKVGIPAPNQENCCKIIFTTRFLEVCCQMRAHEKIKVECLGANEAWKLFEEKVGEETLDNHPDIRELAKQVAAKCGGLPLALIVIGKAMACKKMIQDWKYAIEVLKEFPYKLARMDQEVYSLLKFSYDSLPNDMMRYCFLYCSLFPEDYRIEKSFLIDYWFCEGFLDEFKNISRAQMQGYNIINCLLNACLLERCEVVGEFVKMHDVIRDMALWITRECEAPEKKIFVQSGVLSIEAVLNIENWEGARMSLANGGIEELRGTPTCPNLQTLFLNNNKLKVICDGFFQFMPSLRVLNLSCNWKLRELPEGIFQLVSLEHLDLKWTGIVELPNTNSLSNLKYLNLIGTLHLKKIPRQLIYNISRLQIFRIALTEGGLDEDNVLHGGYEGLMDELKCLQHLNLLTLEIKNDFALQSFLSSHNLPGCIDILFLRGFWESKELNVLPLVNLERLDTLLIIDCRCMKEIKMKIERQTEEKRMTQISHFSSTPRFHTLSRVLISRCDELRSLSWLIHAPNLTWLCVMICSKLEAIMSKGTFSEVADVVGMPNSKPFAKLETLDLRDLPELKSICWDALPFPCLRKIKVFNCSKLKKLPLNQKGAKGNQISIEGYEEWWEDVEWDDEATPNAFLPCFKCVEWWKEIDVEDEANLIDQSFFR